MYIKIQKYIGISISGNPFEDEVDVIYNLRNCAQIISKYNCINFYFHYYYL